MDSVKTLAPILICAMKIYVQIAADSQRGQPEAAENRNYLAQRMTDEGAGARARASGRKRMRSNNFCRFIVNEIIRVLQLTTYDEDEWDSDNVTMMRKALSAAQVSECRTHSGGPTESARRILFVERILA